MEPSNEKINVSPEIPVSKQEVVETNLETIEFVPKFKHIKEDLKNLFQIEVTSETSLRYPWVKDEIYNAVMQELQQGTPFAFDYMFEEKLLTKEDLQGRGVEEMKPYAKTILTTFKPGPRLTRAKDLFVNAGILTQEEVESYSNKQLASSL